MPRFTPLNVHSHYSLLNALPKIPELVSRAKECSCPALALTDNGNLYGAVEFYKACRQAGITPIIGVHAYMAFRTRLDKQAGVDNRRHRLILLAKNLAGYRNLLKLVTQSHLEGFYYRPRIDLEILGAHKEGLLAISPAFGSDIRHLLTARGEEAARERVAWYRERFGESGFFIEISRHPEIDGHENAMRQMIHLAKDAGAP
ncbi:MAG: DNA polymerase III subunit alpha, partial [Parcubacteria group bacterium Greene0416_79]